MDEEPDYRRVSGTVRMRRALVVGGFALLAVCAAVVGGATVAALHASSPTPAEKNPSWLIKNSTLDGKVLHLTEYTYISSPGLADPSNGKLIIGDVWEQLSASGDPIFVHIRLTYPDGTLHQEDYITTQESIEVEGNDYAAIAPHPNPSPGTSPLPANWCVIEQPATPSMLAAYTPQFVNEAALPAAGYARSQGNPTRPVPSTSSLPGLNAVDIYHVPAVTHIWTHRLTAASETISTTTINVDSRGRIVLTEYQTTDASHHMLSDTWFAYGDLVVYSSLAGVPQNVLSVPSQVTKGCD